MYQVKLSKWSEQDQKYKLYQTFMISEEALSAVKINSDRDYKERKFEIEKDGETIIHYSLISDLV